MNLEKKSAQIQIRRYENKDLSIVEEFYARSYQGDLGKKLAAFQWITEYNPSREGDDNYILVFQNGKMVGYWGIMPMRFYLRQQPFTALFSQETLIDPSFRKQGLATTLLKEVNRSNSFLISLWHNEHILNIKKREGWVNVGHFRPLKKIYKVDNLLRLKLKQRTNHRILENILLVLARRYYRTENEIKSRGEQYHTEAVARFDSEYDGFFLSVAKRLKLISDRRSHILNWKYIDIPHRKFHAFCARKNGIMVGYIVLTIEKQEFNINKGIVVDLLIDPDERQALVSLLRVADQLFIENRVDFSVCQVSLRFLRSMMQKQGYYQGGKVKTNCLLVYNAEHSAELQIVRDINNWYFTYGESDYTMW